MNPLFTPRSAREAVLSLRPAVRDAVRLYRALAAHAPAALLQERPVDQAYFAGVRRLLQLVEQVRARGAEIDLVRGGLRFPARRGGREAVLRWELCEPHSLWHGGALAEEDGGWEESR